MDRNVYRVIWCFELSFNKFYYKSEAKRFLECERNYYFYSEKILVLHELSSFQTCIL